jgi:hypothetical protein
MTTIGTVDSVDTQTVEMSLLNKGAALPLWQAAAPELIRACVVCPPPRHMSGVQKIPPMLPEGHVLEKLQTPEEMTQFQTARRRDHLLEPICPRLLGHAC